MSKRVEEEASTETLRRSLSSPGTGSDASGHDGMIKLRFSQNSVFNTIISSAEDDHAIMYEVLTPQKYTNRVTTIYRLDSASGGKIFVGEIEWKAIPSRMMVRLGEPTSESILMTVDDDGDNESLAIFREAKRNALLKIIEPATLRVYPDVLPDLDRIVGGSSLYETYS
ncbi:hypothetical protein FRB96_003225 [Tulasnella sp. 330]|nr:hypothetical protein FRB96_003225 [Tulasnella sp. 330]KAG8884023.1 hypothetical protein FRB98_002664 [Tulasnella sp. 332]